MPHQTVSQASMRKICILGVPHLGLVGRSWISMNLTILGSVLLRTMQRLSKLISLHQSGVSTGSMQSHCMAVGNRSVAQVIDTPSC